jgi:hypothetical protein
MSTTLKPTPESFKVRIAKIESDPVSYLFGQELGTAKLARDGKSFRIFYNKIEDSKSGKAILADITVFMTDESLADEEKPYTYITGVTYLPNFVVDKKMVYFILEKKIDNIPWRHEMSIDSSYVQPQHKHHLTNRPTFSNKTPEVRAQQFLAEIKEYHKDWEASQ